MREFLKRLVEEPDRRRIVRARLQSAFEKGLVRVGKRAWSRDDLYVR